MAVQTAVEFRQRPSQLLSELLSIQLTPTESLILDNGLLKIYYQNIGSNPQPNTLRDEIEREWRMKDMEYAQRRRKVM